MALTSLEGPGPGPLLRARLLSNHAKGPQWNVCCFYILLSNDIGILSSTDSGLHTWQCPPSRGPSRSITAVPRRSPRRTHVNSCQLVPRVAVSGTVVIRGHHDSCNPHKERRVHPTGAESRPERELWSRVRAPETPRPFCHSLGRMS